MAIEQGKPLLASDIQNLTFFPKGTILMYDGQLWDRTGGIPGWHICDGEEGTIDLRDKFIRGGTTARQTGGTDTAEVPKHDHTFTGIPATGSFGNISTDSNNSTGVMFSTASGVFSGTPFRNNQGITDWDGTGAYGYKVLNFSMTPQGNVSAEGLESADNRPAFCTVIFIEKTTAYLT
jgi:hypothetical protein